MSHANFVHLRVHSAYSLLEGAIRIPELVDLCVAQRMPAVAVTDTNNLFGGLEFAEAARAAGVQPIMGAQVSLERGAEDQFKKSGPAPEPDQLVLLAQDEEGRRNLMALLSQAWLEASHAGAPHFSWEMLAERAAGLVCLTGGVRGPMGRMLLDGQADKAEDCLLRLKDLYGDRLYVEVQRHGTSEEAQVEDGLLDLAYRHDVPLVATNDCYFPKREMYEAHDALLCIAGGAYVSETDRRRLTPEHCFKPAEEMQTLFADLPEAVDNTLVIARRCHIVPEGCDPLLPDYTKLEGRTSVEALREMAATGLETRLKASVFTPDMDGVHREEAAEPYRTRLAFELDVIEKMGFPGYFLIVADFIQWAKQQDIPVGPGRGSGAGSVVAWALTITDLDPLRFGLLFERFLNPERVSMPDFDIDFCQDRRDEVIDYVQKEYGEDRVAQIITFGKLQARAVLRDVGRVLHMSYGQVDRICKLVPNNPANPVTLKEAIDGEPLLQKERDDDPTVANLMKTAMQLEGLYRHASTHAAGVVIGDRPLQELVALYRDPRSQIPVTQFNMKWVEKAGLVKFDFLGLKTLTVIARAKELIDRRDDRAEPLDIAAIPLDDAKTYAMLQEGDTTGVFQMESSGLRNVLRELRPDRLEDLIAAVALYRPGPMENIPTYIARKHGREHVEYLHPLLEPVLKETYGIPVYQEQVMQMAQTLAGYSLGAADLLRRAMGKKVKKEMDEQRRVFVDGAHEHHRVDEKLANEIFGQMAAFAGYGFNKSHAAAYALVAYQTAWLKANYPVEFLAASMTLDMHNTDKLSLFRAEADRQKVRLAPPDINKSHALFSVERDADGGHFIRYALAALRNVGTGAMEAVEAERTANGPYRDMYDFVERVDSSAVNKRSLEYLVSAGAFDSFDLSRRAIHESLDMLIRHGAAVQEEKNSNQNNLFGGGSDAAETVRPPVKPLPDWTMAERLAHEHDAVGFYLSGHPLDAHEDICRRLGVKAWAAVQEEGYRKTQGVKLAGIVTSKRITRTSKGSKMAFVTLSDTSSSFEVTLFQEVLNTAWDMLESSEPLLVTVDIQHRGDGSDSDVRLTAQGIRPLADAVPSSQSSDIRIHLRDDTPLPGLASLFQEQAEPGRGRVTLRLQHALPEREIDMELPATYRVDDALRRAITAVPGVVAAERVQQ